MVFLTNFPNRSSNASRHSSETLSPHFQPQETSEDDVKLVKVCAEDHYRSLYERAIESSFQRLKCGGLDYHTTRLICEFAFYFDTMGVRGKTCHPSATHVFHVNSRHIKHLLSQCSDLFMIELAPELSINMSDRREFDKRNSKTFKYGLCNFTPKQVWDCVRFPQLVQKLTLAGTDFSARLDYLPNLQTCYLNSNIVDDWSVVRFPKTLRHLDMSSSNFCADLSYVENLRILRLCCLQFVDASKIRFPPRLELLDLSHSNWNEDLSYLPQLQTLNLVHVQIGDWNQVRLPKSLRSLDVSFSNFNGDLSYLPKLKALYQCYCKLSQEDWEKFFLPSTLHSLDRSGSNYLDGTKTTLQQISE